MGDAYMTTFDNINGPQFLSKNCMGGGSWKKVPYNMIKTVLV
jgi:hypothetical protein